MSEVPNTNGNKSALYQEKPGGQFKEGNPGGGRPVGSLSLTTLLKNALQEKNANDPKQREYAELLVQKLLVTKALNEGDMQAIKEIFERVDGKVPQGLDVNGNITVEAINKAKEAVKTLIDDVRKGA